MSVTYPDLTFTTFPDTEQSFVEMIDLTSSDGALMTQYQTAMQNLYKWNQNITAQKKQHDDFPDSLAGMITNVLGGMKSTVKVYDAKNFGI